MDKCIKIWTDESSYHGYDEDYTIIGHLIHSNSGVTESELLRKLREKRYDYGFFDSLHGNELGKNKQKKGLAREWMEAFNKTSDCFFGMHMFPTKGFKTYNNDPNNYLARQTYYLISSRIRDGYILSNTEHFQLLHDRKDLTPLKDFIDKSEGNKKMEDFYEDEIKKEFHRESSKKPRIKFSFVNDKCFDFMQLTDLLIFSSLNKIRSIYGEKGNTKANDELLKLFDLAFAGQQTDFSIPFYNDKFHFYAEKRTLDSLKKHKSKWTG